MKKGFAGSLPERNKIELPEKKRDFTNVLLVGLAVFPPVNRRRFAYDLFEHLIEIGTVGYGYHGPDFTDGKIRFR